MVTLIAAASPAPSASKPAPNQNLRRRSLLGLMAAAATAATGPLSRHAFAGSASMDAAATIQAFNTALLAAMKAGDQANFSQRFQALAPAVEQAFDLRAVLEVSIGPSWPNIAPTEQARLLDMFRRYTVASYVANFDRYAGQTFTIAPNPRSLDNGRVIVQTRIVPVSGDATELDYVMQQTALGWKVVDVLAAGSISRVAVQRSDFRRVLSSGGGDALVASLRRKITDLSGGALA